MQRPGSHRVSRQGVSYCQRLFDDRYGWLFREQSVSDYGIDAHVEVVAEHLNDLVTGKMLGLQIKSGKTYFKEPCDSGWILRPSESHVRYWAGYSLPVVIVIYDPETERGYWQTVNGTSPALARLSEGGWKLWVPESHDLEALESKHALMQIIGGGGHYTYSLPNTAPWNAWKSGVPVSWIKVSFGPSEPWWQQPSFWELWQHQNPEASSAD
ncbi:DUF4365 domain-containing protein [Microbispora bryophytorum]|uniref:DUF4365 domain-containing protein n=1 Tax=Microbispora bryophytorum subsp. camponoti TaxID=1677852 RepID=A0ABR8L799_9ACTN|nr:DUF4365 domain-containing protein [Microbispora camponoti]MBD3145320.1 DUF4365 domain-containing protein [Microbispora camponoti]